MTAIADEPVAETPIDPPKAWAPPTPVATLSADLMPDEVVVKRRLGYLKRRLVFVMAALVALVVLGDLLVRQQTGSAQSDLTAANNQIATLNTQLTKFSKVQTTRTETQVIWTQLAGVMGDDVSWLALLDELTRPAVPGMHVAVVAQLNDPDDATSSGTDTSDLVPDQVGTVTLTGTAPSWQDVVSYVHGLSAIKGFAAVNPSAVSHGSGSAGAAADAGPITFTVTLDVTSAALSKRYAATGTAPSTKPASTFPSDKHRVATATGRTSTTVGKAPVTGSRTSATTHGKTKAGTSARRHGGQSTQEAN